MGERLTQDVDERLVKDGRIIFTQIVDERLTQDVDERLTQDC